MRFKQPRIESASPDVRINLSDSSDELLFGEKESDLVNCAVTFIFAFSPTSIPKARTYAKLERLWDV